MSANVPATRPPQKAEIAAGGQVAALIPQNLEQAFRLSQALAASGMAPRGIDKPEQIMVAIMAGAELGLAPFQSLQSFAVVNGRPTLWGDGLMAVVRARGVKVKETLEGEGEDMVARCFVTRADTGEEVERTFSVADAKKANLWSKQGPWQTSPKRMLQMRARAFALRDGCADMLRGIQVREEVEDYQDARVVSQPRPSGLRERLSGPQGEGFTSANAPEEPIDFVEQAEEIAAEPDPVHDAEFTEADEPALDVNDAWDHIAWSNAMREAADSLTSPEDVQAWFNDVAASAEYQQLIAADEAEALALKAHVVRHKKALTTP